MKKTYKNVCELFCQEWPDGDVRCCHFCPKKSDCPSTWGECLNHPDKCGYYAAAKKISGELTYCNHIKCLPPDEE